MTERKPDGAFEKRPENCTLTERIAVTDIHINFKDRDITFWAHGTLLARLSLAPQGVIFEVPEPSPARFPGQIT